MALKRTSTPGLREKLHAQEWTVRFKHAHPKKRATKKAVAEYKAAIQKAEFEARKRFAAAKKEFKRRSIAAKKGWHTRRKNESKQFAKDYRYKYLDRLKPGMTNNEKDLLFAPLKPTRNRLIGTQELKDAWKEEFSLDDVYFDKQLFIRFFTWSE